VLWGLLTSLLINATSFNELQTVFIEPDGFTGIEISQEIYFGPQGQTYWQRHHLIMLSVSKEIEMGIDIPWLNLVDLPTQTSNVGDIRFYLNFTTHPTTKWIRNLGAFNYILDLNAGTGTKFFEKASQPLTSYGFQEWRFGFTHMKTFTSFSVHTSVSYSFRSGVQIPVLDSKGKKQYDEENDLVTKGEDTVYGSITNNDGLFLNFWDGRSWKQWLGFNWNDPNAFFYRKNLENDLLIYKIAINTDLFYPFIPFVEYVYNHDFLGSESSTYYEKLSVGTGVSKNQIAIGGKFLLNEEYAQVKFSIIIPLGAMRQFASLATNLGFKIDF